ncbi:exosortase family protein XrtG [Periweissella beninensis]|uniref:Exosortase family protein XrtG n=1 Tax=Periweissella beninensis TaxID=504936 RepID=A0ABT0VEZ6_9LACO|nr:exosortase family protein XrtG [Periweissella beninensis]MBM7545097.1 exosortase family protein XrtG [Periweissella beninensis]MCM2436413.1 exosortase family protein XrtG [Periweissella beninensis]MCT4396677.1 exosortase family protein XrtG [Periweissella beninensis]
MLSKTIIILSIIIWVYGLSVLKRAKTDAFYFLFGSVGLFIILILLSKPYGVWLFSSVVTWGVGIIGKLTGLFTTFYSSHIIQVIANHRTSILLVDYECSGIIETTAFWGLIAFYPVYRGQKRLLLGLFGFVWIYMANVIRLSFIAVTVYYFGNGAFYLAHSIIGRLIFYTLAIILYYVVFTKGQLVNRMLSH